MCHDGVTLSSLLGDDDPLLYAYLPVFVPSFSLLTTSLGRSQRMSLESRQADWLSSRDDQIWT